MDSERRVTTEFPTEPDPLRYMDATKGSPCHYCDREILKGYPIAGQYGILWGHRLCVQLAYLDEELILSPNNRERRPLELKFKANRVYTNRKSQPVKSWEWRAETTVKHFDELKEMVYKGLAVPAHILNGTGLPGSTNQATVPSSGRAMEIAGTKTGRMSAKAPNFSNSPRDIVGGGFPGDRIEDKPRRKPDQNINDDIGPVEKQKLADGMSERGLMDKPKSDCKHFKPVFVCRHKIPRDMRPSRKMLDGDGLVLGDESLEQIIEKQKEAEYQRRYEKWKRNQHSLPACAVHAHLKVVTVPVPKSRHFDPMWEADIWLVCAHEGEDKPLMSYRGYELL